MWSSSTQWKTLWEEVQSLEGGGQGAVKQVRHRESGVLGFLKTLNRQNDPGRRARFFREAVAYATSDNVGIPKLYESNADHYIDLEYKLYIITEFVEGLTLANLITASGAISGDRAVAITSTLLDVVIYCHHNEWVHRDIKPDNIILRDADSVQAVLLDFGLAYKDGLTDTFATEAGEEVGNRFLRLPELRADSPTKRDVRSDLSFVGAILYYLVTGMAPVAIRDETGKLPHQRPAAIGLIRAAFPKCYLRALAFFDRVFNERISGRFDSSEQMRFELMALRESDSNSQQDSQKQLEEIVASLNNAANVELATNKRLYDTAMNVIIKIHRELLPSFSPVYNSFQTGYTNFATGLRNDLGYCHFSDQNIRFAPSFLIQIVGSEIVTYIDGVASHRTEISAPVFDQTYEMTIRNCFISGMRELVTRTG